MNIKSKFAVAAFSTFSIALTASTVDAQVIGTPKGAVVAFNLEKCPGGWSPFALASGRTVIGAGQGYVYGQTKDGAPQLTDTTVPLTNRFRGNVGGLEGHTLGLSEMPNHKHVALGANPSFLVMHDAGGTWRFAMPNPNGQVSSDGTTGLVAGHSEAEGGATAFSLMQPWVALLYCTKN